MNIEDNLNHVCEHVAIRMDKDVCDFDSLDIKWVAQISAQPVTAVIKHLKKNKPLWDEIKVNLTAEGCDEYK